MPFAYGLPRSVSGVSLFCAIHALRQDGHRQRASFASGSASSGSAGSVAHQQGAPPASAMPHSKRVLQRVQVLIDVLFAKRNCTRPDKEEYLAIIETRCGGLTRFQSYCAEKCAGDIRSSL
jgi:hypothetical protein